MATKLHDLIAGPLSPALYVVRYTVSFPWRDRHTSPLQYHYVPGQVERPLGKELQLSIPSNTLVVDCSLQPNPNARAWFVPRFLTRPARAHVLVLAILKRTRPDFEDIPLWLLREQLTRFGIAEHLSKQGLLRNDTPDEAHAVAREMLPRAGLEVWSVSQEDLRRRHPARAFSTQGPRGGVLISRSLSAREPGFGPGTPDCRLTRE